MQSEPDIQFKEAMLNIGLEPPEEIIPDGELHRFGYKKTGWYVFHNDNIPAGAFGNWKTGLSDTWKEDREYSPEEKVTFKQRMDAIIKQREAEQQKRQADAKKVCNERWNKASRTINHAYLDGKQVNSYGLKQDGCGLLIPIRKNKELVGIQAISPDGRKQFNKGGGIAGGYHVIGKSTNIILIGEGYATLASAYEATGFCSVVAFNAGNLKTVAETIRSIFPENKIIILADNDQFTEGNPGITKATDAAKAIGAYTAIPEFKDTGNKLTDFNDLHCTEGLQVVRCQIESALDVEKEEVKESPEEIIQRLSKLSSVQYEAVRVEEAKKLNFRASALDKDVAKARKESEQDDNEVVTSDEPYSGDVDGQQLLYEISELVDTHMILPVGALPAVTMWILSTYVYTAFRVYPKLAVISPEKRCGKSTLLDILSGLANRTLLASNITPSAIFRSIDMWKPTLIIDEADTFLSSRNDDLIGIINSGHTKTTAFVVRTVGDDHTPKKFNTFAPMAFASIKGIVGTVMDRSVIVHLRRRMSGETVKRMSVDFKDDNTLLRQKLTKWANDNFTQLKHNYVEPPEISNDRAIDNWLPLFTIAHAIGGEWPKRIEASYFSLNSLEEEETTSIMLLQDIKSIFTNKRWIKTFSLDLVDELIKIEERPWIEWKKGKPMTQNSLAKILKTFSIHSKMIRIDKPGRGYEISQFQDAFSRYVPDTIIQSVTTLQPNKDGVCSDIQSVTNSQGVTLRNQSEPKPGNVCNTVTLKTATSGDNTKEEFRF